uniref:Shugoshin_C domain-containing protein n=1 Tax=Parastrongyloides trichosuri TaxID=131310 RepID=A0A0N4Z9V9_PARTI
MAKTARRRLSAPASIIETPLRGVTKTHLKKNIRKRQSCGSILKSNFHNVSTGDKTLDYSKKNLSNLSISPFALTLKLQEFGKEFLKKGNIDDIPDAKGISERDLSFSVEEYEHKKNELLSKCKNADALEDSHLINLDLHEAVVAGAKCLLTEKIGTRSITKKLCEETGVTEEKILFDHDDSIPEHKWTAEVDKKIKDSVFETLSDLKTQINFKSNVLQNMKTPDNLGRRRSRTSNTSKETSEESMKTPLNSCEVNPLSLTKIQNDFAARIASDLRHRRISKKNSVTPFSQFG